MDYGFSVPFAFPLLFTTGVWDARNPTFADTLCRLEPGRRHRVLLVVDDKVAAATANLSRDIAAYFAARSSNIELAAAPVMVPGGEDVKNDIAHVLELIGHINQAGIDRQSFVAVLGGGAVLDMASFAAAIAHRGIRAVRLPTTVLSQADSGVGVKNGINLFGKKNFAGSFAPPFAVINDSRFLETLERRDRISGVSEAIKVALLKDPDLLDHIEARAAGVAAGRLESLPVLIRRSAELHLAHICGNGDPFERGSARPLDFGHWAAHKLESITCHEVRHGEAVAIGMALDVIYSVRQGFLDRTVANRILNLIRATGFELWHAAMMARDAAGDYLLLSGLREFREHLGGELHITLLSGIGSPFEVTEMDEAVVLASLHELEALGRTPLEPMAR